MVQLPDPSLPEEPSQKQVQWPYPIADMVAGAVPVSGSQPIRSETCRLLQVTAAVTLLSCMTGLVWGSHLASQELKLRLETSVEATLNRPIQWGRLRGISPNGIRLGKTTIPPINGDASSVQIDAIDIAVNWQALLGQQTPTASITLVRPHLSLVQNPQGEWPFLPLTRVSDEHSAADWHSIESIAMQDGLVTVSTQRQSPQAAVPRSQVIIDNMDANATVLHDEPGQPIAFSLKGQIDAGGFEARGRLMNQAIQARVQAYDLPTTGLNLVLPAMVSIQAGILNSNLSVSAALTDEAQVDLDSLDLQGTTIFKAGQVFLGQLPEPVSDIRSSLWFEGQQVTLHNTGLQIGDLALSTEGTVSLRQGYNLIARVPAVSAADIQNLAGDDLPVDPRQTFQWQTRVTGPLREPYVEGLTPPLLAPPGELALNPGVIGISLGMRMLNLPLRDRIPLIEGASYDFRGDGAWFRLTDGTVVPPLSEAAYQQGARQLNSALSPSLDRKFFWLLQTSPYVTAIAADLGKGRLREYLNGNIFDTDRFFLDYFIPVYRQSSSAAGLDPGESLWMLDHSLRTLQDPLLRTPSATPITAGAGTVGSFWAGEQILSMQQLILRPQLAQTGQLGNLAQFAVVKQIDLATSLASRRLSSTPELMSKIPNVTFGAEEGAIAHALGLVQLPGPGLYSEDVRTLADSIVQNEFDKQRLRSSITGQMQRLSSEHTQTLGTTLAEFSPRDWDALGLGPDLGIAEAAYLNGTNTFSVLVSRSEKAGYPLAQAYQNSHALWLELLQDRENLPAQHRLIFALLKDQAFNVRFWDILARRLPHLASQLTALAAETTSYRQLAEQGATLHEQFYAAMVRDGQDISVSAAIKHAVGFQAHLAKLLDQAFTPTDPADPRYLAFRRSLAIYLRESPDIAVYGGTEAALRFYGYETLNVQEMLAVDVASAPRIRALARLYTAAWQGGMIGQWDIPGFQRILLLGSMLAAGVERHELPADLAAVGFPSDQFRRDLLFVVGPEGIKLEATRLGIQAHDHRVSFQPVAIPEYRAPSFAVTDASACPTRPAIQAIALGPKTEFVWYPTIQQVVLKRGDQECLIYDTWTTVFFDTLLESVPVVHSPEGAAELQAKLRQAQLLEAGIF